MNVIIIEDEAAAARKLSAMLCSIEPAVNIIKIIGSVKESVKWLKSNKMPDAAFVDIQLSDGQSFDIFRQIEVNFPVVFTTAFDDYILQSFEYNLIDYILKPITEERLKKAFEKIQKFEKHFFKSKISKLLENPESSYRKKYIVKKGIDYISIETSDIAYFFSEHKIVFLKDNNSVKYIIGKPLNEIYEELDPSLFFRLNRQFLASRNSVKKFKPDTRGKIIVELSPPAEVIISKENAPNFKKWIGNY